MVPLSMDSLLGVHLKLIGLAETRVKSSSPTADAFAAVFSDIWLVVGVLLAMFFGKDNSLIKYSIGW